MQTDRRADRHARTHARTTHTQFTMPHLCEAVRYTMEIVSFSIRQRFEFGIFRFGCASLWFYWEIMLDTSMESHSTSDETWDMHRIIFCWSFVWAHSSAQCRQQTCISRTHRKRNNKNGISILIFLVLFGSRQHTYTITHYTHTVEPRTWFHNRIYFHFWIHLFRARTRHRIHIVWYDRQYLCCRPKRPTNQNKK